MFANEKGRSTVAEHLKNIFANSELDENSTCRKFRQVGVNGKEYNTNFYDLEAVIAVGFRTNSDKVIQFRRWAITILKKIAIR